jgi:hypothetical protein
VKGKWKCWLPILLMVVFAVSRWPGLLPWNFSAFYALAFCAGVYFPQRLAWLWPLAMLFEEIVPVSWLAVTGPLNVAAQAAVAARIA